jgi:RNA methyltransferase, TrmH family
MLSRNQIKFIQSLRLAKFRKANGLFVAEGPKIVEELIVSGFKTVFVYGLEAWLKDKEKLLKKNGLLAAVVSPKELERISSLTTPNQVLAVCRIPERENAAPAFTGRLLALDGIRDPGNMGTIIRTADWFGIHEIICSDDCVEVFNPKVVQATMGSIARVKLYYTDLRTMLSTSGMNIYASVTDGVSIWDLQPGDGIYVVGNESTGIRPEVLGHASHRITIPRGSVGAESLNASVAAGIILAAISKRQG